MDLREFVRQYQMVTLDEREDRWKSLESDLKLIEEELSEEILPDGIYDYLDPSRPVEYYERPKTYRIKDRFDGFYIIKKSELELGDVYRPNLRVELGRVRISRLQSEKEALQEDIILVEDKIRELHFNEFLYGVPTDNQTIEVYEGIFPNRQTVLKMEACPSTTVNWKQEGF